MIEAELDVGAITIDTCILERAGYKFNEGILNQMVQFADSPVRVIQTDIVHQEAKKHIADEINTSKNTIKKALRLAKNQLGISEDTITAAQQLLEISAENNEIAEARLIEYYQRIGAEVIETDKYIDAECLMKKYFNIEAPFEEKKDKKNEFPDAIALISLERWAEENNLHLVAVSGDKGWKNFAKTSNRIIVIDNLADAIAKFQPHNQVNSIITRIRESTLLDEENYILQEIEAAIIDSLDGNSIYVEASSSFYYEDSDIYSTYKSHEYVLDDQGLVAITIVKIKDNVVVLQVSAEVTCEVSANFDFSIRDPIDRDYMRMGSATYSVEEVYDTDILISLTGDFTDNFDNLEIDIEVLETITHADFGEIEPNWRDEEED